MLELAQGLTIQKIINAENVRQKLIDRHEYCQLMWTQAYRTIDRMEKEGKELKAKLAALPELPTLSKTPDGALQAGQLIAVVVRQLNVHQNMDERQIDWRARARRSASPRWRA